MNLDELKKLAMAATPGPWELCLDKDKISIVRDYGGFRGVESVAWTPPMTGMVLRERERAWPIARADAAFIAAFNPSVALKLISALEIQREALEKYSRMPGMSVYADAALAKVKEILG